MIMMNKDKIFRDFNQKNAGFRFLGHILTVLMVVFMLELAQITQLFIDSIYTTSGNQPLGALWGWVGGLFGQNTTTLVLVLTVLFVVVAILKNVCYFGSSQCFFKAACSARSSLRRACFKKLSFSDNLPSAKQVFFNLTSDVTDFADVLYIHKPKMFEMLVRVLLAGLLCFIIDFRIAIGFMAVVPIMFAAMFLLEKKLVRLFSEARNRKSDMFGASEEMIRNIKDIKTFGAERWAIEKYSHLNKKQTEAITKSNNLINKHQIPLNILRMIGITAAFALSALACFLGTLTVGYFVLIMTYAVIIFDSAISFILSYYEYKASAVSARRLAGFLDSQSSIKPKTLALEPSFDIEFCDVCFKDNGQQILNNASFVVPYKSHTAIICSSDSGKTAIMRLLLRFVNFQSGKILVGGVRHEEYNISSLRQGFSLVSQEPAIFEGTVLDNITMFSPANKEKLENALNLSDLKEIIEGFSDKENHFLAESGKNLPSQVRQKIAIARALYRDAPVLILDSAFNKFPKSEAKKLIANLKNAYSQKTILFLTEDTVLAKEFDIVIKLKNGGENE